jgi:hypothetical protein
MALRGLSPKQHLAAVLAGTPVRIIRIDSALTYDSLPTRAFNDTRTRSQQQSLKAMKHGRTHEYLLIQYNFSARLLFTNT